METKKYKASVEIEIDAEGRVLGVIMEGWIPPMPNPLLPKWCPAPIGLKLTGRNNEGEEVDVPIVPRPSSAT